MRRIASASFLLALGLACSGVLTDVPLPDAAGDDAAGDDDEGDDDDDDDDEPEERDLTEATPDCTIDMMGVLVGLPSFGGPKKDMAKGSVEVKKGPNDKSKTFATISAKGMVRKDKAFCKGAIGDDACVGAPVALEHFGLPVYQEKGDWALVGVGRGGNIMEDGSCQRRMWVHVEEPLEVQPVEDLLDTDMAYIRAGIEVELFDDADGDPLDEQPDDDGDRIPARVIRTEEVDGRPWVKVELYDQLPCDGEQEEIAEGWMPLHDDSGRLRMWFVTDC